MNIEPLRKSEAEDDVILRIFNVPVNEPSERVGHVDAHRANPFGLQSGRAESDESAGETFRVDVNGLAARMGPHPIEKGEKLCRANPRRSVASGGHTLHIEIMVLSARDHLFTKREDVRNDGSTQDMNARRRRGSMCPPRSPIASWIDRSKSSNILSPQKPQCLQRFAFISVFSVISVVRKWGQNS